VRKVSGKKPAKTTDSRRKSLKAAPKKNGKSVTAKQKAISKKITAKTGSEKKTVRSNGKKTVTTGIKKQYLKTNGWCNVTFKLPKEAAPDADLVTIVGDFNEWNLSETKMKKMKNGNFQITLKLHKDREYRFRYFVDATRWENDWQADSYVPNAFGCDDSLVIV
jgi:1,4-alpha-glucan branching enzyme